MKSGANPSAEMLEVLRYSGWIDERKVPILAAQYPDVIVYVKYSEGGGFNAQLRDVWDGIQLAREHGKEIEEIGLRIGMFDLLCAIFMQPNRYSTNLQAEQVN